MKRQKPAELGIRAYARYRGVSQTAVQKAIKQGRITLKSGKKIDVAQADAEWQENSSPLPPSNGKREKPDAPSDNGSAASFAAARARKEAALADLREAELAEKLGQLIPVDYANSQLRSCIEAVGKPLRGLTPRLIRELARAGVVTPAQEVRARAVIDAELDRIHDELQHAAEKLDLVQES